MESRLNENHTKERREDDGLGDVIVVTAVHLLYYLVLCTTTLVRNYSSVVAHQSAALASGILLFPLSLWLLILYSLLLKRHAEKKLSLRQ